MKRKISGKSLPVAFESFVETIGRHAVKLRQVGIQKLLQMTEVVFKPALAIHHLPHPDWMFDVECWIECY